MQIITERAKSNYVLAIVTTCLLPCNAMEGTFAGDGLHRHIDLQPGRS